MRLLICAFLVLSTFLTSHRAFSQTFTVLGFGNESCGTWNIDRQSDEAIGDEAWVLGFVSASNAALMGSTKKNVTITTDMNGVFGWIDNYCKNNPTNNLTTATEAFWVDSATVTATAK
jgi:hypothetical protein